tara:strand:- start:14 stop:406 length:393 start_codon:yes stop_codon:yes gene_type:complete
MSENFKVEIVNPDQSFFTSEEAKEVVIPAIEGEMGILKDHISIISFLKPGIIKINLKDEEQKFYVEDGIIEFKDNLLSILTSKIYSLKNLDQNLINQSLKDAEKELENSEISDQSKFIYTQKVEVLKNLN